MTVADLITVILTTLNSERYLERSIDSCLAQTHANFELLIVDGGSQDGTLALIAAYSDSRLRVIHQPANSGKLPGALNIGMAAGRGAYITWSQDDCWYEPHALARMCEYLDQRPEVGMVYADYWDVDEAGQVLRYQRVHGPEDILTDDVMRVCFLFRREVYETIGPQETKYHPVHERPWRINVARRFPVRPLHVPLMYYTVHNGSLTGRIGAWELQRLTAAALHAEGHLDDRAYRAALAQTDIYQAYEECVLHGDYRSLWRHAPAGLWRDPRRLANRGLLKLMLRSLLPGREQYRQSLYARWRGQDTAAQEAQREQALRGGQEQ